ncbi:hypothetical protein [Microbulbifer sp. JTAC008]|uniref:hypothetical protein n=1 Tax=unclassified Microbulbifer TaxID=2619833 RepID=UPI004039BDC9
MNFKTSESFSELLLLIGGYMKPLKSNVRFYFVLVIAAFVGGCADSSNNIVEPEEKPVSKAFSITLESVEVERLSNGEAVSVDAGEIKNEALILVPNLD